MKILFVQDKPTEFCYVGTVEPEEVEGLVFLKERQIVANNLCYPGALLVIGHHCLRTVICITALWKAPQKFWHTIVIAVVY